MSSQLIVSSHSQSFTRDSNQLFVGNLPHNCTEDELVELFTKFGKVNDVRINQKQARQDSSRGGRDGKQNFVSCKIYEIQKFPILIDIFSYRFPTLALLFSRTWRVWRKPSPRSPSSCTAITG